MIRAGWHRTKRSLPALNGGGRDCAGRAPNLTRCPRATTDPASANDSLYSRNGMERADNESLYSRNGIYLTHNGSLYARCTQASKVSGR